jgi:uncharacterized protein YcbX
MFFDDGVFSGMLTITGLYTYPVKSFGGTATAEAVVDERGFQYDRRWMVVDSNNRFLTQRELPAMALLKARVADQMLIIEGSSPDDNCWSCPVSATNGAALTVSIFDEYCEALPVGASANEWLSLRLGTSCRLVVMPDSTRRPVDPRYARNNDITGFTDGYPFLLLGEASLESLNDKLEQPVPMNRFRPNIVIRGSKPYDEERLTRFDLGPIHFYGVKNCGRCQITTVDQETAATGREPLRTLAAYRRVGNKVLFGRYLLHKGTGKIRLGDAIENAEF